MYNRMNSDLPNLTNSGHALKIWGGFTATERPCGSLASGGTGQIVTKIAKHGKH